MHLQMLLGMLWFTMKSRNQRKVFETGSQSIWVTLQMI